MTPYFFGYGSLVNRATHDYPDARHAQLQGWRRAWVRTHGRDIVYLTVVPDPSSAIDGLIAAVPDADWGALDLRETGYQRHSSGPAVVHEMTPPPQIAHYVVPPESQKIGGDHHILLSYLDVVTQGFHREFGTAGVTGFYDTTDGWDTPVFNDRTAPRYPRAQELSAEETALVDHHLGRVNALVR
ncbi:gamma-glutamylcyclotransferase [Sulfitobacter sp. SK012]|uniref:gamma-glutamylcyclotransferase family protein n=1 Tax=Sulfitobacter sp. SK012 TaxID=1389005 RepID=UPI000E0CA6A5|nr:gamma-glutamylcyclotransferase family protein [Sulfitobacter sp. SK012]AXI48119.1 gamma-glutamylcyclotransferase [Sulfitobacter sp. SK012]